MPVIFAFLIFSSSPYDIVYCTHENTMAPIANNAPNWITFVAILITYFLVAVTPPHVGRYPLVPPPQSLRNVEASPIYVGSQVPTAEYAK